MILEGRVTVNGEVVRELGTKADPAKDAIKVDGRRIKTDVHASLHRALQAERLRHHAQRSGRPAHGDGSDWRGRLHLPGRPAGLRLRGPAADDDRRRSGRAPHASAPRSRQGLRSDRDGRAGSGGAREAPQRRLHRRRPHLARRRARGHHGQRAAADDAADHHHPRRPQPSDPQDVQRRWACRSGICGGSAWGRSVWAA